MVFHMWLLNACLQAYFEPQLYSRGKVTMFTGAHVMHH